MALLTTDPLGAALDQWQSLASGGVCVCCCYSTTVATRATTTTGATLAILQHLRTCRTWAPAAMVVSSILATGKCCLTFVTQVAFSA